MTKLLIVESPGKIKKIKSYLGNDYNVMASVGHIRDLGKSLSIDINNNFEPSYEILADKKIIVKNLKDASKNSTEILIASDGDREGEAIAYHLVNVLKITNYKRIIFNEITKTAIITALENPRLINMYMFYSQQTRRLLDRLVGYKLSPLLKNIPNITSNNLGAGRVQSVVTRLIIDKENDINKYVNIFKYNISGNFTINNTTINACYDNYGYDIINTDIIELRDVNFIILMIKLNPIFDIYNIQYKDRLKIPLQPFITSTLQQESSIKFHFQLKKTMILAQKLYEKGLITYMRTDSPNLSNDALTSIKNYILGNYGEIYYQYKQYKSKKSNAQEAHEAIRPTHIDLINLSDHNLSDTDEEKLYILIWSRTIASQMKPAIYSDQNIRLINKNYVIFNSTLSQLSFQGYLKVYNNSDNIISKHIILSDNICIKWKQISFKESYSNYPTRYNEASLVKKLEQLGIGRPSTYANIISKIQDHNYIKVSNIDGVNINTNTYFLYYPGNILKKVKNIQKIGNEKCKLIPTNDGIITTEYLINNFPEIMDYNFTSNMEILLDEIAEGKKNWIDVLTDFYNVLSKRLIANTDYIHKEQNIIGKHPKYGDITYMNAKYGMVFKIICKKKTIFINANYININNKILDEAIKAIDKKKLL